MPEGVDQVADFKALVVNLAAEASDVAVAPLAVRVGLGGVASLLPKPLVEVLAWVDVNDGTAFEAQVLQDGIPEIEASFVIFVSEAEVAQHLEGGEVATVSDFFDVVRADARLEGSESFPGSLGELLFPALHP